jgi:hypothetical protein
MKQKNDLTRIPSHNYMCMCACYYRANLHCYTVTDIEHLKEKLRTHMYM